MTPEKAYAVGRLVSSLIYASDNLVFVKYKFRKGIDSDSPESKIVFLDCLDAIALLLTNIQ